MLFLFKQAIGSRCWNCGIMRIYFLLKQATGFSSYVMERLKKLFFIKSKATGFLVRMFPKFRGCYFFIYKDPQDLYK